MPWVNQEMCTGCEICVDSCITGAISVAQHVASINDDSCIRCGVCHEVCPSDAIRHDGERIPQEVEANLQWVKQLLSHHYYAGDGAKQRKFIDRMVRYFNKDKKVAEKTIECLQNWENTDP